MASRDGENTRFPLLAKVRILVATLVTLLAIAVVVMVIVVVHRPVELQFQSYSYVQTEDWWWIESNTSPPEYTPATEVDSLFIVDALNPSGRGKIHVNINLILLIDTPNASFTGMVEFYKYKPETPVRFDVLEHSKHRYGRWVNSSREAQLHYLYDKHLQDGDSGFPVMVVVNTTYKPAHSKNINATYYCWPVTFLRSFRNTPAGDEVTCKTPEEIGYTISWEPLPELPPQ